MAPNFLERLSHAYNAFNNKDEGLKFNRLQSYGESFGFRPDRTRLNISNERSIVASIYTRLSIDISAIDIRHVRLDENDRYVETIKTGLNTCLTLAANIDQVARQFKQDIAMSLFDKGVIAIVPVDTSLDPAVSNSYEIKTMRVGEITQWYPQHVRVNLYNDKIGRREEVVLKKDQVAIVENPLYSVMNEPNSTLQRLIRKLNILDAVDEASSSGKLDLIIQLPYVIKSDLRKQQAEQRAKDIETQLKGSKYGIAYTDGTEKITQLNRPAENNLLAQIEYLTKMVFNQLGLSEAVLDGTASEAEMLNYYLRTVEPILASITQAMKRSFLTTTAITQLQSIEYFRDPFKLVPVADIAEIADKFTRNEIMTANEMRAVIGLKPSDDPKANKLINSNMPQPEEATQPVPT